MLETKILRLSKVDASTRQLNQAIQLFFDEGDPVSIHTLVEAAGQVLRDVGKSENVSSLSRDNPLVNPEQKKEWLKALVAARNFFKHADKDKDATLTFNTALNETTMLDAVAVYQRLTGTLSPEMHIYLRWYAMNYPDNFMPGSNIRTEADRAIASGIAPKNSAFFKSAIQFAKQQPKP